MFFSLKILSETFLTLYLSTTNETQRYAIFFIVVSALHVSSGFSAHHQELKNCMQHRVLVKLVWCDAACAVFELLMMSGKTARNM
jgi:hypothetical protein